MNKLFSLCFVSLLLFVGLVYAQDARVVAKKVFPSVVEIITYDKDGEQDGVASGFFVSADTVITNYHVIEGSVSAKATVVGSDTVFEIEGVLGVDPDNDLALLKVKNFKGTPLLLADVNAIETGQLIYALGNPKGLEGTISPGIVSGLNLRSIGGTKYIQITAPISKGSSGGPVVDSSGAVIGVATVSYKDGQNLNFAIPSSMVQALIEGSKNSAVRPISRFSDRASLPPPAPAKRPTGSDGGTSIGSSRTNSIGMEFMWIPPGDFMMGSPSGEFGRGKDEGPQRKVSIKEGFWLGKFEVTQGQWREIMGENPSAFGKCGDDCPVERVSWEDAKRFIAKMNARNDGFVYSLPSEAEWEYAARAGTTGLRYGELDSIAWHADNSGAKRLDSSQLLLAASADKFVETLIANGNSTHTVGGKRPNAWGLYDMIGNVYEWVEDIYFDSYVGLPTDGSANSAKGDSSKRVLRGGAFSANTIWARAAHRYKFGSGEKGLLNGLRVVARPVQAARPSAPSAPANPSDSKLRRNSIGMELVWISPGEFMMGSSDADLTAAGDECRRSKDTCTYRERDEGPQRKVVIGKGFWMGRFEVTQGQWRSVMGGNPSQFESCGDDCPVEKVSWNDAKRFIEKLNAKNDGFVYSLPTEAEWEYAARAGSTGIRHANIDDSAWYANNAGRSRLNAIQIWLTEEDFAAFIKRIFDNDNSTHPVGKKAPNAWGLYDMYGNVWEWVEDIYSESYDGLPTDGSANLTRGNASMRVRRGGSWLDVSVFARSAVRLSVKPDVQSAIGGFRVVARANKR